VLLLGLENIGIVSFQKKMEFGQEFRFFFAKRIIGFIFTIASALYLHSYWALVIGTMAGRTCGVLLSYVIHPMRPRLSWVRMGAMLSFSTWNLARGISGYLAENLHRLLVGRREDTNVMGAYTMASDIAAMPSSELLAPLNRVLFPMFVTAKENPQELKRMYLLALGLQAMVGVPAGVGLAMVAPELVMAMLGEKWMMAVPFVQIMGGVNIISALANSGGYVLLACGRAKVIAIQSWSQVLLFFAMSLVLIPQGGAIELAETRMGVAGFGLITMIYLILRDQPNWRVTEMVSCVWRTCMASLAMVAAIHFLPLTGNLPAIYQLLIKIAAGAIVYSLSVWVLWRLSGRPDGGEAYLLQKVSARSNH
jgi:O-antigen/teichoic acid export membrane protein